MNLRHLARAIAFGCATLLCGHAEAGSGTFNTLTYNIAGTPTAYNGYSSTNTALISCYVKTFNIVNVQEDFLWHATLYDTCDNHPYRTPTSGTAGIGDGLNTLSSFWFDDLDRVTWTNRADSDALTPKGFSLIRVRLAEGVYVDFYNLHAQSGTSSTDLADSVSDVNQMLTYIEANSAGNAVMVMGDTNTRYTALATALVADSHVLFGLTNEPHGPAARDADLATAYANAIAAIRAVEDVHGAAHHVVVVQAPEGYARDLTYFVAHPLAGDQIAYEVHPYNAQADFDALIVQPAKTLPILIGEYGPAGAMTDADIQALWTVAEANGVPYIAWNFHQRCPPNLLQDTASDGCGLDPALSYAFPRTAWGDLLYAHLQTPW